MTFLEMLSIIFDLASKNALDPDDPNIQGDPALLEEAEKQKTALIETSKLIDALRNMEDAKEMDGIISIDWEKLFPGLGDKDENELDQEE